LKFCKKQKAGEPYPALKHSLVRDCATLRFPSEECENKNLSKERFLLESRTKFSALISGRTLLSQEPKPQVSSGLAVFTIVFGMGTSRTQQAKSPRSQCRKFQCGRKQWANNYPNSQIPSVSATWRISGGIKNGFDLLVSLG